MPIMLLAVCANINSELQPHNVLHSLVYNIDKFHSKLVCVGLAPIISLSPSIIKVQVEYDGRKLQFYFLCPCVWKGCAAAWCCGAILIVKFSGTFIWRASFTHQYKFSEWNALHCSCTEPPPQLLPHAVWCGRRQLLQGKGPDGGWPGSGPQSWS